MFFLCQRLFQRGKAIRVGALEHGARSFQALAVCAHPQIQFCQRIGNFTAQAVVGACVFCRRRQTGSSAADRVDGRTTTHDESTAFAMLHFAITQGIQKLRHAGSVTMGDSVLHGRNTAVVVAIGHGQGLFRRERMGRQLAHGGSRYGSSQPGPDKAQER